MAVVVVAEGAFPADPKAAVCWSSSTSWWVYDVFPLRALLWSCLPSTVTVTGGNWKTSSVFTFPHDDHLQHLPPHTHTKCIYRQKYLILSLSLSLSLSGTPGRPFSVCCR